MRRMQVHTDLLEQLHRSLARAKAEDLDLPSTHALSVAERLLRQLGDPAPFEVFVADDGTIEITAVHADRFITVDVSPGSARLAIVVTSSAGATLCSAEDADEGEVLRQLRSAA